MPSFLFAENAAFENHGNIRGPCLKCHSADDAAQLKKRKGEEVRPLAGAVHPSGAGGSPGLPA